MQEAQRHFQRLAHFDPDGPYSTRLSRASTAATLPPSSVDHISRRQLHIPPHAHADVSAEALFEDNDVPLDAFDKQLLSLGESTHDCRTRENPSDVLFTPLTTQTYPVPDSGRARETFPVSSCCNSFTSSSPSETRSSPVVSALQQRALISRKDENRSKRADAVKEALSRARNTKLDHASPIVQGITLVPSSVLPDRFRAVFPYPIFNAVQSRCFPTAFDTNDNLVLSAPTGSGKTLVMELSICQLVAASKNDDFKVIYQAPTKALCSERFRDWQAKFSALDLHCAELTGDTQYDQLRSVQSARIIITTPEKWDSVTRKWKDNAKLMRLVKLFLIDEVHILKETRGATLEAVVSRMKAVGSDVRFIALSATIPNSEDVASWLGRNANAQQLPAHLEVFGENFRPVQLQKIVKGYTSGANSWAFDKFLSSKVPEMIAKYSSKRPVIIFCPTRASAVQMSIQLADLWKASNGPSRLWHGPQTQVGVRDTELQKVAPTGVAFHHGGLDADDRLAIEDGFLRGDIVIICSTSTLAVGVNLPCYLVIIKGTMGWTDRGLQEYSGLEITQMLGRAGRPQFENAAYAVVLTREENAQRYERMVSGSDSLESCLHENLIEHLNAEIGLGSISDITSATRWLEGTFLFVRLRKNPGHYRLQACEDVGRDVARPELVQEICQRDIKLLQDHDLVSKSPHFRITEFGDAMARYCVSFDTMKVFLALPPKARTSEILSVLAQATEFRDVRYKSSEKSFYKEINQDSSIKFPIKVDIAQTTHKVSLLIQHELGACIYPPSDRSKKYRAQFHLDKALVFKHVDRLIRCIIDCQLHSEDSISARNALDLARSLAAKVWDGSALQLKQIDSIGDVTLRKLASAGINSIETLENTEPHRIEMIMGRNPPFGHGLLAKVARFPNLRVSVKRTTQQVEPGKGVKIGFRADIGFVNASVPVFFRKRPVYVCFLAETAEGKLIDFRRMSAKHLRNNQEFPITAHLRRPLTSITCYVMCDEVAGTCRQATINLDPFPTTCFPQLASTTAKRTTSATAGEAISDDFDDDLADSDLLSVQINGEKVEVVEDIDDLLEEEERLCTKQAARKRTASQVDTSHDTDAKDGDRWKEPVKLANGRWTCQHTCGDEGKECKHKCCKDGVGKPRKRPKIQPDDAVKDARPGKSLNPSKAVSLASARAAEVAERSEPQIGALQKTSSLGPTGQEKRPTASVIESTSAANNATDNTTRQLPNNHLVTKTLNGLATPIRHEDWNIGSELGDLPDASVILDRVQNGSDPYQARGSGGRNHATHVPNPDDDPFTTVAKQRYGLGQQDSFNPFKSMSPAVDSALTRPGDNEFDALDDSWFADLIQDDHAVGTAAVETIVNPYKSPKEISAHDKRDNASIDCNKPAMVREEVAETEVEREIRLKAAEQKRKWEGIPLPVGFEDMPNYVELI